MKIARFSTSGRIFDGRFENNELIAADGTHYNGNDVTWLPPSHPSKIIGIALNFADHATELSLAKPELPAIFIKPTSSLIGHRGTVLMPPPAASTCTMRSS